MYDSKGFDNDLRTMCEENGVVERCVVLLQPFYVLNSIVALILVLYEYGCRPKLVGRTIYNHVFLLLCVCDSDVMMC